MNENAHNPSMGRPKVDLDIAFTKIQSYLELGYSFHKSCVLAEYPYSSIIIYYNDPDDDTFRKRCERERSLIGVTARRNLADAVEAKDLDASREWLSTQEKDDWNKRQEVIGVPPQDEGILILREIITERRAIAKAERELKNDQAQNDQTQIDS